MSQIVPFASATLPAYLQNRKALASINADVMTAAAYPTMSIKGKTFTLVKDGEKKLLTTVDADGEAMPAQSVQLNVIRANTRNRVYYGKSYVEGESDGARPTCFSNDGKVPSAASEEVQATKCAICPHAVWGSKMKDDGTMGEGTECSVNTRLAVTAPDDMKTVFLLRVPAGSRKNFAEAVKAGASRGIPYNAMVMKVSFDPTAPSPKLVFKPVGLLDDATFETASGLYEDEMTKTIIGVEDTASGAPALAGPVELDELDAAIATKAVVATAKAAPAPAPAVAKVTPKPAAKPAPAAQVDMAEIGALVDAPVKAATATPKAAPAPKPAASVPMDDLLSEMDGLLGNHDD